MRYEFQRGLILILLGVKVIFATETQRKILPAAPAFSSCWECRTKRGTSEVEEGGRCPRSGLRRRLLWSPTQVPKAAMNGVDRISAVRHLKGVKQ